MDANRTSRPPKGGTPNHRSARATGGPSEFRIVALRECESGPVFGDCPEVIAHYWRRHIAPGIECMKEHLVVFLLDARLRVMGHHLVAIGTLNSVWTAPREVYRAAIIGAANSIVLAHNHPSGDARPGKHDIAATKLFRRAGKVIGIELLDHIIIGSEQRFSSLRGLGYFFQKKSHRRKQRERRAKG